MVDPRTPRELENRDADKRDMDWKPASLLPEPDPTKHPGWGHKYIRISVRGQNDPTNVSALLREGWEPVNRSEYPEIKMDMSGDPKFKDNIEFGGLLLCRMPEERIKQRRDYYLRMNQAQIDGVDRSFMRANDPRMPMDKLGPSIERKSTTTFGRGNR